MAHFNDYRKIELKKPKLAPHSRLYNLEPNGVGTPYVESLTSYITRLAEAHSVQVKRLFISEVAPLTNGWWLKRINDTAFSNTTGNLSAALNNSNSTSAACVVALSRLTTRQDLKYLTMGYWERILSNGGLIRASCAWCSDCYEQQRVNGWDIYDHLLWTLKEIEVCPRHALPLSFKCFYCASQFSWLGPNSRIGHCPKCHQWLGRSSNILTSESNIDKGDAGINMRKSEAVGALLAAAPEIVPAQSAERFRANLIGYINRATQGCLAQFAELISVSPNVIKGWKNGTQRPQLRSLIRVCAAVSLMPIDVLSKETNIKPAVLDSLRLSLKLKRTDNYRRVLVPTQSCHSPDTGTVSKRSSKRSSALEGIMLNADVSKYSSKRWNYAALERIMRNALDEYPPPSISEISSRYGIDRMTLRRHFPQLYREINLRVVEHRKRMASERVKPFLIEALEEYPPLPMTRIHKRISEFIGCRGSKVARIMFPSLCQAIAARHAIYRKERSSANRALLKKQIRRVVMKLNKSGIYPSEKRVRASLINPASNPFGFFYIVRQLREELDLKK